MRPDSSTRTIPLTQGKVALVDAADFEMLNHWKWHVSPSGYAMAYSGSAATRNRQAYMHRVVMLPDPGLNVDHINHDGLDNRRANLRVCQHRDNQRNQRPQAMTSSRYKGVSWHPGEGKWRAVIGVDGRQIALGYFHDEREAAMAYDVKARELFGAFALPNFEVER